MTALVTYRLNLHKLDTQTATFSGIGPEYLVWEMPTDHWVKLGRPSAVEFTPMPAKPLA